jgi:hypothetical protein
MVVGICVAAFGLLFLGLAAYSMWSAAALSRIGLKAQALVVGYQYSTPDSEGKQSSYPKIQYKDAGGISHTVVLSSSTEVPIPGFMLWEGQTVPICYDPHNPNNVQVETFIWKYLLPSVAGVAGLGFGVAGILCIVWNR